MENKDKKRLKIIKLQLDWYSTTPASEIGILGGMRFLNLLDEYEQLKTKCRK